MRIGDLFYKSLEKMLVADSMFFLYKNQVFITK